MSQIPADKLASPLPLLKVGAMTDAEVEKALLDSRPDEHYRQKMLKL